MKLKAFTLAEQIVVLIIVRVLCVVLLTIVRPNDIKEETLKKTGKSMFVQVEFALKSLLAKDTNNYTLTSANQQSEALGIIEQIELTVAVKCSDKYYDETNVTGKNCKKKVNNNNRICIPSTSASVAIMTLLYRKFSNPSSIFKAACNKLNSSFSYTTFLVNPYAFKGFPRKLNTACVLTSLDLVIDPLAESPSVIKMDDSFFNSWLVLKCTRQSRNFRLCRLTCLARSRAIF